MHTVGTSVYAIISRTSGKLSASNRHAMKQNAAVSSAGSAKIGPGRLRSFFFTSAGTGGNRNARTMARKAAGTQVRTLGYSQPPFRPGFSGGRNRWMKLVSNFPAAKSASARMRLWSGMEV